MARGRVHVDGIKAGNGPREQLQMNGAKQLNLKIRSESDSDLKFKLFMSKAKNNLHMRRRRLLMHRTRRERSDFSYVIRCYVVDLHWFKLNHHMSYDDMWHVTC